MISASLEICRENWIFIPGATGGVGHFATQIAKYYGLKVIGSAGKAASLDLLHKLNMDCILDYSKQDIVKEIFSIIEVARWRRVLVGEYEGFKLASKNLSRAVYSLNT